METITEIGWARREYADELMAIWEASVRATHHFLKESDIRRLRPRVREALKITSRLFAVNCDDEIAGFMGVSGDSLDMLFLLPGMRGRKLGRRLLDFAVNELKVRFVDVNEENPAALGFYLHCNFAVYARSERDGQGRPFPILHLTRKILETERLLLRELTPEDFDAVAAMLRNPRVMRAWERTFSDDEIRSWIERHGEFYREYGYGYWLAVDKTSGEAVGQIGLLPEDIEGRRHLGIGWMLAEAHWHRGYAVEGARECLDYAFNHLGAGRVIADIRPENTASLRVAEKLGMIPCGEFAKPVGERTMVHRLFYLRTPRVTVVDYDPAWRDNFRTLARHLAPLVRKFGGRLEHVGSTAVPGLAAKAVIDADYIPADEKNFPEVKRELEALGFFHRGDGGLAGREMFTESLALDFRHNFYVCQKDSPHLANHLALRDYLRRHPEAAAHYGELKKELARQYPAAVDVYCAAKSDFLSGILAAAGFEAADVASINRLNRSFGKSSR